MTKSRPSNPDSKGFKRVLEFIARNPGLTTPELARLAGYTDDHTSNTLTMIRRTGKAVPVPQARARRWYTAADAAPMLAEWESRRRRRPCRGDSPKPRPQSKRDAIAKLAEQPGGVSMAQIMAQTKVSSNAGGKHCLVMCSQGRLFRSFRPGARIRWFSTEAAAQEWAALPKMEQSEWSAPRRKAWEDHPARLCRLAAIGERIKSSARQPSKAPPKLRGSQGNIPGDQLVVKAKPGNDAPVSIKSQPKAQPDFSLAKTTRIEPPKFVCRWQQQPDSGQSIFADWPRYGTGA